MPFNFDFVTTNVALLANTTSATLSNTADGVRFTVSGDPGGGADFIVFGNGATDIPPILLNDQFLDDVFSLTFKSDTDTSIDRINGDATVPINLAWAQVAGTWQVAFRTDGGGVTTPTGSQFLITDGEDSQSFSFGTGVGFVGTGITGVIFSSTNGNAVASLSITSLSGDEFNCFCTGTQIATPSGSVAVEEIAQGDLVMTADGRAVEVKWVGHQSIDTRVVHPAKVNPVCISAGALGEGVPARDLYVSPDHAVGLDGYLINAGALVNGESIYQVRNMPLDGFTYYHIETEAHELLLAEGCPAESFLDYSDTFGFDNANERDDRVIPEMAIARISSARFLPDGISSRLRARAARIGDIRLAG